MFEPQVPGKFVFWLGLIGSYTDLKDDPKSALHNGDTSRDTNATTSRLVKCIWDTTTDEVKLDDAKSVMFKYEYICSCLEYAPDCLVVSFNGTKTLFKVSEQLTKIEPIDASECDLNENKFFIAPMPGFDVINFPFLVCTGKSQTCLINVETKKAQILFVESSKPYFV